MADHNYLYKVLGLSALPRVLTFGLTLLSFPLLLRGLGAAEYGVMVYLTSVVSMLELVAGFGVGAAVGDGGDEGAAMSGAGGGAGAQAPTTSPITIGAARRIGALTPRRRGELPRPRVGVRSATSGGCRPLPVSPAAGGAPQRR